MRSAREMTTLAEARRSFFWGVAGSVVGLLLFALAIGECPSPARWMRAHCCSLLAFRGGRLLHSGWADPIAPTDVGEAGFSEDAALFYLTFGWAITPSLFATVLFVLGCLLPIAGGHIS